MAGVPVVNPEGEIVQIPALDQQALLQGYRAAEPHEVEAALADAKYGGAGQGLAAFGEGTASALTFGLSSGVERALGVPAEDIRGRQEAHPVAHGAGTTLGIAAPLVLSGGLAAPVEGAAAAGEGAMAAARAASEFTAPALIARAGKAVAGALPEGAGTLARVAAAGATEGALYAGSDVTEKALLGDPGLTFEGAAAELGLGALFGGALAGGTDVAVKGLGKVLSKATAGLETVASKMASGDPEVVKLMLRAKEQVHSLEQVAPGAAESIAASTPETAQFIIRNRARIEKLEGEFPGLTDILSRATPDTGAEILNNWGKLLKDPQARIEIGKSLEEAVNTAYRTTEDALRSVNRSVRPAETERLAASVDPAQAHASFVRLYRTVDDLARKMRAEPDLYQASAARELELIRDGMARDAQGLTASSGPSGARSRESKVITPQFPDGEPVRYEVHEADQVEPSHSWSSFRPNERFPEGIQERNYLGQKGEQEKVERGARELIPSLVITDTPSALDGPPLVTAGAQKYVLGGNGRTMMLKRAIAEHPERYAAYKQELLQKAEQFGIPSKEVAALKNPLLVRVAQNVPSNASKAELVGAVRRFNEGMTQQFSPIAKAIAQSKTMSPGAIESLGDILGMAGDKSLRDVMRDSPESILAVLRRDGIANAQNEARWLQGGQLTDAAKDEIEGMFLGRIFESEQRYSATAPDLLNKVERAAPHLIKVAGQTPDFDEIPAVRGAIDLLNGARAKGLNLDDYLFERTHQATMLGAAEPPIERDAAMMAHLLDKSGQRAVQARFREWGEHLNPQTSLFGPKTRPTVESSRGILYAGVKEPKPGSLGAKAAQAVAAAPRPTAGRAQSIHEAARAAEPSVTAVMQGLEGRGARLVGLEHRFKAPDQIERGLGDAVRHGVKPEEAQIGDALRYTLEMPHEQYAAKIQDAISSLKGKGYELAKFKNFWGKKNGFGDVIYQGVNTNWKDPHGNLFEVQFHTPDSLKALKATHTPYEEYRLETTPHARRAELSPKMGAVHARVPLPPGAADITAGAAALPAGIPPGHVFHLLNRTKQLVDAQSKFGKLITPEWRRTADALKGLRTEFKAALEDEETWGAAGARQKAFNSAQNAYFTARQALTNGPANQKLMQKLVTRTGSVDYEANPRSINSWINLMADGRGGAKSDSFNAYLKASKQLADEMEASGYPSAGDVRSLIHSTADKAAEIRQRGTITQLVKMLQGHEILSSGPAIPMGQQMALAAARRLPGGVGHIIGGITGTIQKVRQPSTMVAVLSVLDKLAKKASSRMNSAADALFSSGASGAAGGSAAEHFAHGGIVTPEKFSDVSASLRSLGGDLDALSEHVSKETGHLQDHAPGTATAAHAFAARVVSHLGSKLPDAGHAPAGVLDGPFEPSAAELADYNKHHEVAERGPLAVLEHIGHGTLLPDHLEASRKLFPKLHAEAQHLVADKLAGHLAAKKHIPIHLRDGLGMLLGSDLERAYSGEGILAAQMAHAGPQPQQQPAPAPKAGGKPRQVETRISQRTATGSQGTEMRMGEKA